MYIKIQYFVAEIQCLFIINVIKEYSVLQVKKSKQKNRIFWGKFESQVLHQYRILKQ